MATRRFDYEFIAGRLGWTESWYHVDDISLEAAFAQRAKPFGATRGGLLGKGARLAAIRVVDIDFLRQTTAEFPEDEGIPAGAKMDLETRTTQWDAVQINVFNGDRTKRRVTLLRGFPDGLINRDRGGAADLSGELRTSITQFANALRGSQLSFRIAKRPPEVRAMIVQSVIAEPGTGYLIYRVNAHGLAKETLVTVRKAEGLSRSWINGRKLVQVVDENNLRYRSAQKAPQPIAYDEGTALLNVVEYAYPRVDVVEFVRFTHRDTGYGVQRQRGRSRNR